jgi:hypothetical protein
VIYPNMGSTAQMAAPPTLAFPNGIQTASGAGHALRAAMMEAKKVA